MIDCISRFIIHFGNLIKTRSTLTMSAGFSVSQSLVLCLRNAFDITIRQTINPVPSQKGYYRLQELELRFVLQMQ